MAAPFSNAVPKTRLVFEKSSFVNPKSSHGKHIETKYFTHSVNIIVPYNGKTAHLPSEISGLEEQQMSHVARNVPADQLLDKQFIEAFVKRGQLYLLSHKRHIDTQDCIAIIPTGHLILSVTKDTYEKLGLEGKPSAFSGKKPMKYVIDIDLKRSSFTPGRKGYDRAVWCLEKCLGLTCDYLFSWTPHDESVCPSSVAQFFMSKGLVVSPVPMAVRTQWLNRASVPVVDSAVVEETEQSCSREALWEWLGAVACGIDMSEASPDSFVSTMDCPSPSTTCDRCCVLSVTGFLTPAATKWLLDRVRKEVETEDCGCRWGSLTLMGFQDCPVSVGSREHGFLQSGDNHHTLVCFPSKEYWLYSAYGQHDFCQ
ncbi:ribonuclease P protein subunit p40-like [Babylonia areolata]|uniref:ribonuclease P protein subunit p40-like n=1 Tax=Babylonia areolata TaxID=304850 RepID=UPI003FD64AAF